jgi:hypothetical protein
MLQKIHTAACKLERYFVSKDFLSGLHPVEESGFFFFGCGLESSISILVKKYLAGPIFFPVPFLDLLLPLEEELLFSDLLSQQVHPFLHLPVLHFSLDLLLFDLCL